MADIKKKVLGSSRRWDRAGGRLSGSRGDGSRGVRSGNRAGADRRAFGRPRDRRDRLADAGSDLAEARKSDAVLLGAVGGPALGFVTDESSPGARACSRLRAGLGLFANLRPALLFAPLADASSLKRELVEDLDILIVRELTGGIYFGEPRGVESVDNVRRGFNTDVYDETEIARIGRVAFDLARKRGRRVCSVDKANVLEVTQLWREVMIEIGAEYPDVELSHMYVDNCRHAAGAPRRNSSTSS